MKALWSQWISKLSDRVPEQTILLVPGHFFYGHTFSVPEEMEAAEVPAFIELSLEGVSPFPLDQLAWGYLHERGAPAYAFATSLIRLRQHLGELELESFFYAFPGFLTQYGVTFERPTLRFLAENGAVSAILYAPRQRVPTRVVSRQVQGEILTDAGILDTRDQLAASLGKELGETKIEEGVWLGDGYSLDANDRPTFHHRWIDRNGGAERSSHTLPLSGDKLWGADLRAPDYQVQQRRERQISKRLWQGVQGLMLLLVLLLGLQIVHWGLSGWIALRESKIAERAPAVARIEQSDALASRLAESADRSLEPIQMLEIVNEVRPAAIFFTRARATSFNQLRIEGESRQGIPTVNAYEAALLRLPEVESVTQAAETRGGQTTFEMTVTFVPEALAEAARTAEAEQPKETPAEDGEASEEPETTESPTEDADAET